MNTPDGPVSRISSVPIHGTARLGKEIKISPKTHISILGAGYKTEFFVDTIEVNIGIGNNHTASLIMTVDAWEALKQGEKVIISTTEDYKKKYVYKIRKK